MRCPRCHSKRDKVLDSRPSREGDAIRRRRQCKACDYRFTTYESYEAQDLQVVKRDGRYEPFERNKLLGSLMKACEKRPVPREKVEAAVIQMVTDIQAEFTNEVSSKVVGEKVMAFLRKLDQVAYVRFASVYRRFEDVGDFEQEIQSLRGTPD